MADEEEIIETPAETPKQEVPVDYKALYEETQAKYKDIDLDRWGKAKDFDFDKAQEALEFKQKQEELAKQKEQEENEADPVKKLHHEVSTIKQTLAQREQAEKDRQKAEWMDKYNKSIDSSIDSALKAEFKDLQELSPTEKKLVKMTVNQTFEEDASQKVPKLNLQSVSKVVQDAIKEVKDNRSFVTSRQIKRGSNAPTLPTAQDGATPKQGMTDSQRIGAMVESYKSAQQG